MKCPQNPSGLRPPPLLFLSDRHSERGSLRERGVLHTASMPGGLGALSAPSEAALSCVTSCSRPGKQAVVLLTPAQQRSKATRLSSTM
ncbi:hypothetical protein EYF80_026155 [Liparis tanakae]|uniref:Uncharacterized protein n=1 Tax=Liparis tanakae TaxID=230148 RepID=A0A4Z2HCR3_9TELE|nr:hypothetical protein EYF80_026155 [Liparis tanakae]